MPYSKGEKGKAVVDTLLQGSIEREIKDAADRYHFMVIGLGDAGFDNTAKRCNEIATALRALQPGVRHEARKRSA